MPKITALPAASVATVSDLVAAVQGGVTKKETLQQILNLFSSTIVIAESQVTGLVADLASKLNLTGGTMSGAINMGGNLITNVTDPSSAQDAATKAYVDAQIGGAYLPLAGGTMSGVINMNSFGITNLVDPTDPQDAATKNYVDTVATGLTVQPAVFAATTANLAGYTYANGVLGVGATLTAGSNGAFAVDGTSPALNARILVKNQSTAAENGIYTLTQVGTAGTPAILTRATDYDTPAEINPGDFVVINNGTVNAGFAYIQTATVAVIGTDAINFSLFGGQFALKGANADITSMSGLTGYLQAPLGIKDANGNIELVFTSVASAVNYLDIVNSITTTFPVLKASGTDTNIGINFAMKGAGSYNFLGTSTGSAIVRMFEDTDNGNNYVGWKAPASIASNIDFEMPGIDGSNQFVLQTNGAGVTSFVQPVLRQTVSANVSVTSGTTVIPFDNTTPQNTEGFSIGSVSITPKSASNILEIECVANCNCLGAGQAYVLALFQDSTASALKSSLSIAPANGGDSLVLRYRMTAGTTSSTTFAFRLGGNSATTVTVGGYNGAGILNGTSNGLMTVKEYSV
jgi:hypothetical protein